MRLLFLVFEVLPDIVGTGFAIWFVMNMLLLYFDFELALLPDWFFWLSNKIKEKKNGQDRKKGE